jgi:CMP/dCMP kinase
LIPNRRSIVISGDLGSGKSTISLQLAARLGIRRISMGDIYRTMAQERGMSALQLNLYAERDEAVDDRVDQLQAEMAKSNEPLVVDSRLAWFYFTDAFKVHLIVDPTVAAERVMSRQPSDVEAYSSIGEAVERLQSRSNSERVRFVRKYGVDKARLRNYDMICDATRARPSEIIEDIIDADEGVFGQAVLTHGPPLVIIDPARIYPSQDIRGLHGRWDSESDFVETVGQKGRRALEPISLGYTGRYFYVVDGHRRLSAALQNGFTLVPARLVAERDEEVVDGLSAEQYFETGVSPSMVYAWEAAHKIELPLPSHLEAVVRSSEN